MIFVYCIHSSTVDLVICTKYGVFPPVQSVLNDQNIPSLSGEFHLVLQPFNGSPAEVILLSVAAAGHLGYRGKDGFLFHHFYFFVDWNPESLVYLLNPPFWRFLCLDWTIPRSIWQFKYCLVVGFKEPAQSLKKIFSDTTFFFPEILEKLIF